VKTPIRPIEWTHVPSGFAITSAGAPTSSSFVPSGAIGSLGKSRSKSQALPRTRTGTKDCFTSAAIAGSANQAAIITHSLRSPSSSAIATSSPNAGASSFFQTSAAPA
jgi:hypothetical protein